MHNSAKQAAQAMDGVLNDTGSCSNSSSPRGYGADTVLPHALFSELDEPALCSEQFLCLLADSEYLGTDYEYQNKSAANATLGSERGIPGNPRLHRPQSPHCKSRYYPYQRGIGRSCTVYNHTSHIYPQSELNTEETWSTFSQTHWNYTGIIDPYHPKLFDYVHESGSKKSNWRKGKKRGIKGSIRGVQNSGGGKADKSVRGRKPKGRHMCAHSLCSKVFSNASEIR